MIDADKEWPGGECTTTRFFDGIDRWRTANPPPGPRVRAAARLQLGNFRRPHQQRWWEALTLTMLLAAAVVAPLATVTFDGVLMVLLVAIGLLLFGVFVYAVYALQLATRARTYPHHPVAAPVSGDMADEPRQHSRGGAHRLRPPGRRGDLPQPLPMARPHTPAAAGRAPATARTTDHRRRGRPRHHHVHDR